MRVPIHEPLRVVEAFVLAGSTKPSIPLAQGRDGLRKDGGVGAGYSFGNYYGWWCDNI